MIDNPSDYGRIGFSELLGDNIELLKIMDVAFKINERIKELERRDKTSCTQDKISELEWVLKLLGEKKG